MNFFLLLNTKWRMSVTRQLLDPIDFHSIFFHTTCITTLMLDEVRDTHSKGHKGFAEAFLMKHVHQIKSSVLEKIACWKVRTSVVCLKSKDKYQLKGIIRAKIKIIHSPSFHSKLVWLAFFMWNTKGFNGLASLHGKRVG